jgi:hypothetical protein
MNKTMKVNHIGYARKSKNGKALKLGLLVDALFHARRYVSKDGKWYVGLVINESKVLDVLEGRKVVTNVSQIDNKR